MAAPPEGGDEWGDHEARIRRVEAYLLEYSTEEYRRLLRHLVRSHARSEAWARFWAGVMGGVMTWLAILAVGGVLWLLWHGGRTILPGTPPQ